MSFKVVRDQTGNIIGFGPNIDEYQPSVPVGASITIENTQPTIPAGVDSDPITKLKNFLIANPDIDLQKILGVANG